MKRLLESWSWNDQEYRRLAYSVEKEGSRALDSPEMFDFGEYFVLRLLSLNFAVAVVDQAFFSERRSQIPSRDVVLPLKS